MKSINRSVFSLLLSLASLIVCNPAYSASLDMNAHSDAARLTFARYVSPGTVGDFGVLLLDKNNKNRDDDVALHSGLYADFKNIRFGGRAFYATPGTVDILAIGFGLQATAHLSTRVSLSGHFYYAPEFTSFLDSEGYREFTARLNLKLTPGVHFYVGYRNIKVKVENVRNSIELDDDLHLGVKLFF